MLIFFIILYLLLNIAAGFYASFRVKSSSDFMVAGRRLPLALNTFALFALWFGSETIFGSSAAFSKEGVRGILEEPIGAALCLLIYGLFFARPLYKLNLLTLGDLFREKFSQRFEIVASLFMVITFFGYIAAQLVALGIILTSITGISITAAILISAVVVTSYTMTGGMWAVSITDFIQGILIIIGLLVVAILLSNRAGGVQEIIQNTPPHFFNLFHEFRPFTVVEWVAALSILGLGSIPSQDVFQRMNSAKSANAAVHASLLASVMYLMFSVLPLFIVLAAMHLYPAGLPSDAQMILPVIVQAEAPMWIQVLFFGALSSAILSTCSGALLAPASLLSENVIKPLTTIKINDRQFLLILRISVVSVAAISSIMALGRANIFELIAEASTMTLCGLLVPMCYAIFHPRPSTKAAFISMGSGFASWVVCNYFVPTILPSLIIGLIFSLVGYWIALIDRNTLMKWVFNS